MEPQVKTTYWGRMLPLGVMRKPSADMGLVEPMVKTTVYGKMTMLVQGLCPDQLIAYGWASKSPHVVPLLSSPCGQ